MDGTRRKGLAAENERSERATAARDSLRSRCRESWDERNQPVRCQRLARRHRGMRVGGIIGSHFRAGGDIPARPPKTGAVGASESGRGLQPSLVSGVGWGGAGVPAPVSSRRAATSARSPLASAIQTSRMSVPSAPRSVACRSSQTCSPSTRAELAVVASVLKQASPVGACTPRYCTVSCWPPTLTVRREPSRMATTVASSRSGSAAGSASPRASEGRDRSRSDPRGASDRRCPRVATDKAAALRRTRPVRRRWYRRCSTPDRTRPVWR